MSDRPATYYLKMYDAGQDESYFLFHHGGPPMGAVHLYTEDEVKASRLNVYAANLSAATLVRKNLNEQ